MADDIRKFFTCPRPSESGDLDQQSTVSSSSKKRKYEQHESTAFAGSVGTAVTAATVEKSETLQTACPEADVGFYIQADRIDDSVRFRLLTEPYIPPENYNFKADSTNKKRAFRYDWLSHYSPWLAYSSLLKGPICLTYVLFPQSVNRGFQGSFITTVCTK